MAGLTASHWGDLFGARARDWAKTWEGPSGYGRPAYEFVLEEAGIGPGTRVLDVGCGAGRFARMAADTGAEVAGLDAAEGLVEIAAEQVPEGDFRVGDLEDLPWSDDTFAVVTAFNAFQFARDKGRAVQEAARVATSAIAIAVPADVETSGIAQVYTPLFPFFPQQALADLKQTGIFALSAIGMLDSVLKETSLTIDVDEQVDCPVTFADIDEALRAFLSAGPTLLAVRVSGDDAVGNALREGLEAFTRDDGSIVLPAVYRVVIAHV
jgi:SAM-dependent methyltransferase